MTVKKKPNPKINYYSEIGCDRTSLNIYKSVTQANKILSYNYYVSSSILDEVIYFLIQTNF